MKGQIVKIIQDKPYGFIRDDVGDEYFFHRSQFAGFFEDLVDDLMKGETILVEFTPAMGEKGKRAANIRRIDPPN